jgi:hypothetical protein
MTTSHVLCLILALASSGCATIMNGTHQKVFFDSDPQGAEIVYREKTYTTPCMISLAKYYKGVKLPIYKTGYLPQEIDCKVKQGGWVWGNILFGGYIGLIVDACTAATLDYVEENHRAILMPVTDEYVQFFEEERAASKIVAKKAAEERKRDEFTGS